MFLDIVYVVVWGIMTGYCFYSAHKVHNILYLAGVFFLFLFGWNLVDLILPVDLMTGITGWVFRGISLLFLLVFLGYYIKLRKSNKD